MIHDSQSGIGSGKGSHQGIWWLPKGTTNGYLVLTHPGRLEHPKGGGVMESIDAPVLGGVGRNPLVQSANESRTRLRSVF